MSSEKQEDFLEVDQPINGQNYVCLSFISPESLIQNKEAFKTAKFLQSIAHEKEKDFKYFYNLYLDYVYKYQDKLQKDFDKENDMKTNIRGVKIRGVYQTENEARARAKKLQQTDSSFNVFVGPVGYWLPWDPCADQIEDEEFANEQLNEMIKKYKENEQNKNILYEQDKQEKINKANKEQSELKANRDENANTNDVPDKDMVDKVFSEDDPWMKNKKQQDQPSEVDETVDETVVDNNSSEEVSETVDETVVDDKPSEVDETDVDNQPSEGVVETVDETVVNNQSSEVTDN